MRFFPVFSGVETILLFTSADLDAADRADCRRAGGTVYSRQPTGTTAAGWGGGHGIAAVCPQFLVGFNAYPLSVAGDSDFRRCPPLGAGPNLGGLTSTHVLNTDLLLNLTAVVLAFAILCLAGVLCAMLLRRIRGLYWPLTLILLVMIWLPLSGNLLLLLMKLQVVPLGKSLLSFVAKVTNNTALYNWAGAALLLALALCWLPALLRAFRQTRETEEPIAHRLALAQRRNALRLWLVTIGCAVVVIAGQLWWDKVASQPPQLSEAVPVTLGSDGMVRLPVEQLRDGKLHRFVWVADDGKAVRFFVINRYPDKLRFGVVFDACLLCGDQGYVMEAIRLSASPAECIFLFRLSARPVAVTRCRLKLAQ